MSNLKKQAVNGILWTSVHSAISVLTGPLLLVVQAQYLTPTEFGTLSVINIFLSIINTFENFGFSTAVIQREYVSKNEKSSLFFLQVAIAVLLGLGIIFLSPLLAKSFDMPSLSNLLPLLSIIVVLNGPAILFIAFLEKEFYFKELSIIQIIRQLTLLISSTFFLVGNMGLKGFIYGQILSVFIMVVLVLWVTIKNKLINIKPHFAFNDILPYIKFGLSIGSKQILTQLTHHIDELIIGYFFTAQALGYYFFAKNLLNRIRILVSTAFSKVLLPLLSKLKQDIERLSRTYNNISKYIGVFAFPLFLGASLTAEQFIPLFFGDEWLPSINFFVILSITYIPYLLTSGLATNLLYSVNKPNWVLNIEVIANTIYVFSLFIVSWFGLGIYAVVWVYSLYLILKTMSLQFWVQKILQKTFKDYLSLFKNSIISVLGMVIIVLIFKVWVDNIDIQSIELILTIIVGVISYIVIYTIIDKSTLEEIIKLIFKNK